MSHGEIYTKPLGVVRILIASQTTEHGLTQRCCQRMLGILPGSPIIEEVFRHGSQSECVIQLPVRQQSRIARNFGTLKFQLQTSVKIDA